MTFGLTAQGFVPKRLADVRAELQQAFRDAFGAGTKLSPDTVLGKLLDIIADRETALWELLEAVYGASYPGTASDISLDRLGEITSISRNPATCSAVSVYLAGTPGTVAPAGSLLAVQDAGSQFQLVTAVTLGAVGSQSVTALTFAAGVVTATATAHGLAVGERVFISGANEAAYNGLHPVASVPDADSFTYAITGTPTSPATGTITLDGATAGQAEAVETGPVSALAGTLNQIVNAVPGWNRVENAEDATLGADVETDAAFRARRIAALEGLGAARLEAIRGALLNLTAVTQAKVFENTSDGTDANGRPPHSIEALVVGGADQDILDAVWEKKAAGIETHGTTTGAHTDSQGLTHTVKFSRPTAVNIHVEVDLTVDAGSFPADGTTQVRERIVTWGDGLEIGEDVVVYPYLLASFEDVPGILDVAVRIGTAINPTLDNNIVIAETEIADFDTSRTTILTV